MPNGRCSGHRTPEGLQRIVKARTVHGAYGADARAAQAGFAVLHAEQRRLLELAK